jgi:cardiolipin synthase (CMP-forming)
MHPFLYESPQSFPALLEWLAGEKVLPGAPRDGNRGPLAPGSELLYNYRMTNTKLARYVTVPNALSASRIVFLPLLYALCLSRMEVAFVIAYALIGATDCLDGLFARWLNQRSEVGKILDSWADLGLYVSSAFFMARLHMDYLRPNLLFLYLFFGLLGLSLVISAIRLKKPVIMHTIVLKVDAILVYFLVIFSTFFNTTVFVTVVLAAYSLGFVESILIFLLHDDVDPDSPTVFNVRPEPKRG